MCFQRGECPPARNVCYVLKRPSAYQTALLHALYALAWQLPLTSFAQLRGEIGSLPRAEYLKSICNVTMRIPQMSLLTYIPITPK